VGKLTLLLLCAFVAFMPFEMLAYFGDFSGAKIVGAIATGAAIVAFLAGHRLRMPPPALVVSIALVLLCAMSLGWSVARESTTQNLPRIALLLIFIMLIWEFVVTYKDQLWVLRSFVIGMLVPVLMAFYEFRSASNVEVEEGARFSGGGHDLNYVAYMCSVAILFAVYLATNATRLDRFCRWYYWGIAVLCALEIFLTGSRGGFVCLLTAAAFSLYLGGLSRRRIVTILQLMAAALLVYLLARFMVNQELLSRLTFGGGAGTSVEEDPRMAIWKKGFATFLQHPIVGVGFGAFTAATTGFGEKGRVAHNTFISVMTELGLVGLTLYLTFLVMLFRAAWRMPRRERLLWLGILAVSFINSMTAGSQIDKIDWFVQGMILVQAAACIQLLAAKRAPSYPIRVMQIPQGPIPRPFGKS
jgi:O-antigen ligase